MRITIDNEDGRGAQDYTGAVVAEAPIKVVRKLNTPSTCTAEIALGLPGLPAPVRKARVVVSRGAGEILFTGYLATEPVAIYAGAGVAGPVYRARLNAVSDEWLLDKQSAGSSAGSGGVLLQLPGSSVMSQLTSAAQSTAGVVETGLTVLPGGNPRAVGAFAVEPSSSWSTNAAAAANATYASYRVINGAVSVSSAGTTIHSFSDADGTLDLASLSTANLRELANDVTLSGAEEPAAYMQEIFQGDGSTSEFVLSEAAFRANNRTLLKDNFNQAALDTTQWTVSDGSNHIQLTSAGLTLAGGSGYDGQTALTAVNVIEMGGYVLAELGGVVFGAGSDGMLAGFYTGTAVMANCFAGFRVRQSTSTTGGVTTVIPMVNGVEAGSAFTPVAGHRYTLRLNLFCVEMQRVPQRYYCMVDGDIQEFGPVGGVSAPMQLVFDLLDEGASSNTPATVLYDSAAAGANLTVTPAACTFTAVNSVSLYASIASLEVSQPGSLWVGSTLPNGAVQSRLIGSAGQGVDCKASYGTVAGSPGKVTFFAGRVPVAGERVTVSYRTERRAVARIADAASVASEATAAANISVPGVSRWLGKVSAPVARSSADCESAANAVLAMSTARSASLAGSYSMCNPAEDIWPGDVLLVTTNGAAHSLLVRAVEVTDAHSAPEIAAYKILFANDWATEWEDGLGLKLSEEVAKDAVLPPNAASGAAEVLANLQNLEVVNLTSAAIQIDAGVAAPSGGGFEVRRRDWVFGATNSTPDLVLRSPVRSFSIPRSSQTEQFHVRMYDGSTPPVYSRFSASVIVN